MTPLYITNDKQEIIETNYWDLTISYHGYFYLSSNAGAFRLLIPKGVEWAIEDEAKKAKDVLLTRGPWAESTKGDSMEILFDDGTDNPYSIHLSQSQMDRWPSKDDIGKTFKFSAWVLKNNKPFKTYESDCLYRVAGKLPYLRPK